MSKRISDSSHHHHKGRQRNAECLNGSDVYINVWRIEKNLTHKSRELHFREESWKPKSMWGQLPYCHEKLKSWGESLVLSEPWHSL